MCSIWGITKPRLLCGGCYGTFFAVRISSCSILLNDLLFFGRRILCFIGRFVIAPFMRAEHALSSTPPYQRTSLNIKHFLAFLPPSSPPPQQFLFSLVFFFSQISLKVYRANNFTGCSRLVLLFAGMAQRRITRASRPTTTYCC